MAPGEQNLDVLLRDMDPVLDSQEYVYATGPASLPQAICTFRETEGITLILPRTDAERLGIPFIYPSRRITLTIHSSLEAVGLFAAVTARLAANGISVNAVSGYFHDHLFVRTADAARALTVLEELRAEHRGRP